MKRYILYNLLALITVAIWGTTFVSTKILLACGLTPEWIFMLRFALAYICALIFSHNRLFANSLRDEAMLLLAGITGGSLYFITENSALGLTFASNVSLILCCAPIFTMMLGCLFFKDRVLPTAWVGSALAFVGVAVVIFNGVFNYHLSPLGDGLTLVAAFSWAVYCFLLKGLNAAYANMFINRKVFFYGLATAALWALLSGSSHLDVTLLRSEAVIGNLLFLGFGASFMCYLMWNLALKRIGVEKTANYIYLVPIITIVTSAIIIGEPVSWCMIVGAAITVGGVFISSMTFKK